MSTQHDCCSHHNHTSHTHTHQDDDHDHDSNNATLIISLILFFAALITQYIIQPAWFFEHRWIPLIWFGLSYVLIAYNVWKQAFQLAKKLDFFNEFSLMGIATLGAFFIGEYAEGVAVMIFYTVGEMFQHSAVDKAKRNIKALLDVRPNSANVFRNQTLENVKPQEVQIGEIIQVKAGEKVPLDGILLSEKGRFNTSSLTGESKPSTYKKDENVLAGMINLEHVIEIKTTKKIEDTSISKILQLVQEASSRKAPTELFIRKFAKIYTPIVFFLALALVVLPYFFISDYSFNDWLYRGLVFLVISCPCALVISIPLGYFGGIGAASRNGILIKGSNFLDLLAKVKVMAMDKTGTVTEGVFEVQKIESDWNHFELLNYLSALEKQSNHPIAKEIVAHHPSDFLATAVHEISGKGLKGTVNGKEVLAGNGKLLEHFNIPYPKHIDSIVESIVVIAVDQQYVGYLIVADQIKSDAKNALVEMQNLGVQQTVMLSGDKNSIVQKVAQEIGIQQAFGELLPEDKVKKLEEIRKKNQTIAFVGDGINDAPVLALSDIGIAMGGVGSDAAIEAADVVIQSDRLSKIPTAIKIGRATRQIVIQNICLALGVKAVVLLLGAEGIANMWEAVFADVGVALLAILNAIRIQRMKF